MKNRILRREEIYKGRKNRCSTALLITKILREYHKRKYKIRHIHTHKHTTKNRNGRTKKEMRWRHGTLVVRDFKYSNKSCCWINKYIEMRPWFSRCIRHEYNCFLSLWFSNKTVWGCCQDDASASHLPKSVNCLSKLNSTRTKAINCIWSIVYERLLLIIVRHHFWAVEFLMKNGK